MAWEDVHSEMIYSSSLAVSPVSDGQMTGHSKTRNHIGTGRGSYPAIRSVAVITKTSDSCTCFDGSTCDSFVVKAMFASTVSGMAHLS